MPGSMTWRNLPSPCDVLPLTWEDDRLDLPPVALRRPPRSTVNTHAISRSPPADPTPESSDGLTWRPVFGSWKSPYGQKPTDQSSRPAWWARIAACTRLARCSLARIRLTCVFAVASLM